MELRHLETFVRVAELGNFTRASEELSVTQPAVTRQIAALEQELHTRLLERMGRRVQMTAAGEALYGYAVQMLRQANEAQRAVADISVGGAGRLAVGASSTAATYILPPLLRQYRESHPGVELSVHTGVSARVADMVVSNTVDVGVVMDISSRKELRQISVGEYAMVVVVSPEHPLAGRSAVGAEALSGNPLILMQVGTTLRSYVESLLLEAGVQAQVSMEMDHVEAIKKMIGAHLGISILPQVAVAAEVASGQLVALPLADVPTAPRQISVIYREDKYLSKAITAFIALMRRPETTARKGRLS